MSNDTSIDAINELEQQLSKELDSFIKDESNHTESFLTKLNAFENAKIDSETEATFDKLQVLMLQCSDFKKQIELLERERSIFVTENNALKNEVALLKTTDKSVSDHDDIIFGSTSSSNESQVLDLQSRLNRALTAQADHQLARSVAEKELVQERIRRMRSEKGMICLNLVIDLSLYALLTFYYICISSLYYGRT